MTIGSAPLRLAVGVTRGWARLYTAGLPAPARLRRLSEIESDVWELRGESQAAAVPDSTTALLILARVLLGLADDVLWRCEEAPRPTRRHTLQWMGAGALIAVALWLAGILAPLELPAPPPKMAVMTAPPPPPPPPPPLRP